MLMASCRNRGYHNYNKQQNVNVATFVAWALEIMEGARNVGVEISEEVLPEEVLQCGFDSAAREVHVDWWQLARLFHIILGDDCNKYV